MEVQFNMEGGDIRLFITLVPKVYLICWLHNFGDFNWIKIGWLIKLNVQTFQLMILIYRSGNFVSSLGMNINLSAIVLSL